MKGFFYSNKILIGEVDYANELQSGKTHIGMEGICGSFFPNKNYDLIRREVQDWNDMTLNNHFERDWSKWSALNFNIQLENGYFLSPEGGYEVQDYTEYPGEPLEVRTAGVHSHIFEDYFVQNNPFLDKSWRKITIDEKFQFEERYRNETSLVKKLSFFVNYLHEAIFSTLAFNIENEKVLFSTSSKQNYFSIIDFENKDEKGNPKFEFYGRFNEFVGK